MGCMNIQDKIFVAGHKGLVGSAIVSNLQAKGYKNILTQSRDELDLLDHQAVNNFFQSQKPDVVFIAAAKVGGIYANNTYRADFIYENLTIQNNVIWSAFKSDCRRLVFLGSSCIYPAKVSQPMQETALLSSSLEETNRPYALAKIAGLELINALRRQYQKDFFSVMPTNLYGPNDNFHPENSHVLPALIRKFVEAKKKQEPQVSIWGSGKPLREFLYVNDCADGIVFLAENLKQTHLDEQFNHNPSISHVNLGSNTEVSIKELAELIKKHTNYQGELVFDSSKPDGVMRKLMDSRFIHKLGWNVKVSLEQGIKQTIDWYEQNL